MIYKQKLPKSFSISKITFEFYDKSCIVMVLQKAIMILW